MGYINCSKELTSLIPTPGVFTITKDTHDELLKALAEYLGVDMATLCIPCISKLSKANNIRLIRIVGKINDVLNEKLKNYEK
ncbi:hypothetical protein MUB16_35455 [Priestia sp. OVL9]|nr:hypothetical protein [Priestia sp. OVL9]